MCRWWVKKPQEARQGGKSSEWPWQPLEVDEITNCGRLTGTLVDILAEECRQVGKITVDKAIPDGGSIRQTSGGGVERGSCQSRGGGKRIERLRYSTPAYVVAVIW